MPCSLQHSNSTGKKQHNQGNQMLIQSSGGGYRGADSRLSSPGMTPRAGLSFPTGQPPPLTLHLLPLTQGPALKQEPILLLTLQKHTASGSQGTGGRAPECCCRKLPGSLLPWQKTDGGAESRPCVTARFQYHLSVTHRLNLFQEQNPSCKGAISHLSLLLECKPVRAETTSIISSSPYHLPHAGHGSNNI